jgi:hypothetical protein
MIRRHTSGIIARGLAAAVLTAVLFLVSSPTARGQASGANLHGTVTDSTGAVIANATITVKNVDTGIVNTSRSNSDGVYTVPNLLPGHYQVETNAPGFASSIQTGLILDVGANVALDTQLHVTRTQENLTVTTTSTKTDSTSAQLSSVVEGGTIRELPLNGRDWTSLATLQPGIAAVQAQANAASASSRGNRGWGNQLSVDGHRPQENNYRIDGVSINDYSNGAPGGASGANLGTDAVAEFSVIQSNYSAEYGRTSGGVINAITRSGTNRFHGSAYEFARNGVLDARNYFNPASTAKPEFSRNQFGGSAGGPIIKDKTFIFGDYEGIAQNQGRAQVLTVPSANARQGILSTGTVIVDPRVVPYLQFYPLPNAGLNANGDTGKLAVINQQILREDFTTVRADHHLDTKDNLFFTYLYDKSHFDIPDNLNNVTFTNKSKRQLAVAELSHTFTSNLLNTLRLGYNRTDGQANGPGVALNPFAADASLGTEPGRPIGGVGVSGGIATILGLGANTTSTHTQNSYQLYDDAFYTRGQHTLKFGFAAEKLEYSYLNERNPSGLWSFTGLANFLQDKPRQVSITSVTQKAAVEVRETLFAGYLEDDWRIMPRLTLNLGVRYEMATKPSEAKNRFYAVKNVFGDPQQPVHSFFESNPTTKNFEPRIGFAWTPSVKAGLLVRGGFGIFDILPLPWIIAPHVAGDFPFAVNTTVTNLAQGAFPNNAYALANFSKSAGTYITPNPKRSYAMNYHFTLEQSFPHNVSASLGYTGSHSLHEAFGSEDINLVFPTSVSQGQFVFPGTGPKIDPNVAELRAVFFDANSHFNALLSQIKWESGKNFQAQASYTWSNCIDSGSSGSRGDNFSNDLPDLLWFDTYHRRGPCDFNLPHNFVANALYELPGPTSHPVLNTLIGGWELGGIGFASSGGPFNVIVAGDPLGLGTADPYDFADRTSAAGCSGNPVTVNPAAYLKTECFAVPAPITRIGNSRRNSVRGPSLFSINSALYKTFSIKEAVRVQFRAEMFNVLNHPNFAPPLANNAIAQGNTGQINATQLDSRQIQLALRATW